MINMSKAPKKNGDDLYNTDQAVRDFCKSHGKKLTDDEHQELGKLLKERASAISDVLGAKVSSVCDDDD